MGRSQSPYPQNLRVWTNLSSGRHSPKATAKLRNRGTKGSIHGYLDSDNGPRSNLGRCHPRLCAFAHWDKASQFEAFSLRSALVRSSNPPVPNGCRRSSASPAGSPKLRPQSRAIRATRRGAMAVRERISALRLPASVTGHPPDFLECKVWVSSRASRHQR
jgi:hypothetical protein